MEEATRLVSTGDCVRLWDVVTMAPLEQFNPHNGRSPVAQACWSSNNQYLVSASSSGDKLVVSSLKLAPVPVVELGEGKKQTRVCLSSSFQFLVSGGLDHCVHIWDLKTSRLHRSLKDHKEEVTCVSFNASDSRIISGSTSGDLVLHSLTTNLSSQAFGHGSDHPIHDLRLSTVKRSLLGTVSDSGSVVLWDSNTQKELHVFDGAHKAPASGVAFSPTSDLLVVSVGLDKKIVCYDTASRIVLRSIRVESPLTSVEFTPDGTGLVVGSTQGKIYQYDLRNSSAAMRVTVAHRTSVTCLRFQSSTILVYPFLPQSSKLGSTKISSKRSSSSVSNSSQPDPVSSRGPTHHRLSTSTGAERNYKSVGCVLFLFDLNPETSGVLFLAQSSESQWHSKAAQLRLTCLQKPSLYSRCSFVSQVELAEKKLQADVFPVFERSGPVPPAAISSSLSQSTAEVVGHGGAAPLSSLQIELIQNMIHETVEECRDACHKDIINLQIEMIRQFYILLVEVQGLMEKYSVNESLVEEIERLREENRQLRTKY
uniref:NEDD1 gamma-tubulin ring complex targeting factor n=1 Tax=Oryzias sinensis TaxID=183150 RepID=A0A8C7YYT7_9TELE